MRLVLSAALAAAVSFGCAAAYAADARVLAAAKHCASLTPDGEGGMARAQWHRRQVACLKDLYLQIGIPEGGAAEAEIRARLDALEAAYYASRALCMTRATHGHLAGGCGTISPAPAEFRRLLKTMIVNADAGWVTQDRRLIDALKLRN